MPRFLEHFGIDLHQAGVDFVDIDLDADTPLYVCPYALETREDEWSQECGDLIRSFFNEVLSALRSDNLARVEHLMGNLHEPNETRLGQSVGEIRGRGVGSDKGAEIVKSLKKSRAFNTGLLSDISETELFIYGIGRDTISDLTTNIIRSKLGEYTQNQCSLLGVPTTAVRSLAPVWSAVDLDWRAQAFELPLYRGRPILLVPKSAVRLKLSIDSQEFYNKFMLEFLQAEYLNAGGALVKTFKNGIRKVTKKSVKAIHPFEKDALAEFAEAHPDVLERYKRLKGSAGPISNRDLQNDFRENFFARALSESLAQIPTGIEAAAQYHTFMIGVLTFLFYPDLINPVKEAMLHDGRKRVDIIYTNASDTGFFHRRLVAPQTRANSVFVECKNYTREVKNPELDQLSGRFNLRRGHFGILLCRKLENRDLIIKSCRDTAIDGRGYMLPLEDSDILEMLALIENGQRDRLHSLCERLFEAVSR